MTTVRLASILLLLIASPSPSILRAQTPLHDAVRSMKLEPLKTVLSGISSGEVNQVAGPGVTALHVAAALNNRQAIELLLAKGANINARTEGGFTPLHWAASRDAVDAASLLVQSGADINATTPNNVTPLHWAASRNATNVIKFLLLLDADYRSKTDAGFKPIHFAAINDANQAAQFLAFVEVTDAMENGDKESHKIATSQVVEDLLGREDAEPVQTASVSGAPRAQPGASLSIPAGAGEELQFVWIPQLEVWVGRFEITNGQYRRFKSDHSSKSVASLSLNGRTQPAVYVSWKDAVEYCAWLNSRFPDRIPENYAFRLPTEKEWVAFAKVGTDRKYPWGDNWPPLYGNYSDKSGMDVLPNWHGMKNYNDSFAVTCPVEQSGTNEWGLCGVGGNVWEWCEDWLNDEHTYKVRHGGSWDFDVQTALEIEYRGFDRPDARYDTIGFRVIVAPKESKQTGGKSTPGQ
jgi:hypothetical protein